DFRSMGYQNGELIGRDSSYSLFDIVHSVKMGVIDSDEIDAVATALDRLCLVHQESDPQMFQPRQQSDGIVIAEHAVSRPPDGRSNARHFNKRRLEGAECRPPVVACQNADIVAYLPDKIYDPLHRAFVHVRVQIAELEYGKSIERTWKHRRLYVVVSQ